MTGDGGATVGIRDLPDDALLVFVSDTHIGGESGNDIFESAAEFSALLAELGQRPGEVDLILAGDFLDLLRMGDVGRGETHVAATLARPEYQEMFAALRSFASVPGHRVVYVIGNHDAEVWWNSAVQRSLSEAGLVGEFKLSYAARFSSLPEHVIYCEHGNQFDSTNSFSDYANPLDTPVGSHIVTEVVRPIGAGAVVTGRIDLRDVSYVFPLAAIPDWIAGRLYYQFLSQILRWLIAPLAVFFAAYELYAAAMDTGSRVVRTILAEAGYDVALLLFAGVVLFLLSRRTANNAISTVASRFQGIADGASDSDHARIRGLLMHDQSPPLADNLSSRDIAVFVSGHTHAPELTAVARIDGRATVIANTGCWLPQLQPVAARFGAPRVFVPVFVQSHVRVRAGQDGVTVELWDHPKPAAARRLPLLERIAIAGRAPSPPVCGAESRVVASKVIGRDHRVRPALDVEEEPR